MCFCMWMKHTKTDENSDSIKFIEKLEHWLFLKSRVTEKNVLPPLDDFVVNPMRESTEVIIGGDYIMFS